MTTIASALSPRRLTHSLSAVKPAEAPQQAVPSLSTELWKGSQDLAAKALDSDYIQGIKHGTLNPNYYGQYSVQDTAYLYNGLNDWRTVVARATHPDVKAFAEARVKSWTAYIQETFGAWHIADPTAVKLSPAAQAYVELERDVAHNYAPLYAVVVMLPTESLWYWLATQLKSYAVETNVYSFWINQNAQYGSAGQRLEQFIDAHVDSLDESTAQKVYRSAMLSEVNFFRSACKQSLLEIST